jgi:hypothetical protein
VKTYEQNKLPFGKARMVEITRVCYQAWKDAFEVEFEDGLSFLEPHSTVRKANRISARALPVEVRLDPETKCGFEVHYDTGEVAEVSWSFVREFPPKQTGNKQQEPGERAGVSRSARR